MTQISAKDVNVGPVLFSASEIAKRVATLGTQIAHDYGDSVPIVVGILKGSFLFLSDLVRAIDIPLEVEFLSVSSYGAATKSSGLVRVGRDFERDITGRDILIVEDIVDTGKTLTYLREYFDRFEPATIKTAALLLRDSDNAGSSDTTQISHARGQENSADLEYHGFTIKSDTFVIGYGLDHDQRYRNLTYIAEFLFDSAV